MSIKQQRGSTQGLVVVSWSRCCGLCSFWGDGERVFLGEGKPDLKYDTFFFFSLFIGGLFFSFHPLREWGTAHLLLTELVSFCNQDLLSGFFPNIFPCCPVGLLCLQLVSSLPTVCVFFLSFTLLLPVSDIWHVRLLSFLSLLILCMFFLIYFIKCQLLILLLEFIPCYKMLPHSH